MSEPLLELRDLSKWFPVRRSLAAVQPAAIVLVEAELWPNFLWQAQALRLPVCLANARISDRSFPRYRRAAFLFRELFAGFAAVGAQKIGRAHV